MHPVIEPRLRSRAEVRAAIAEGEKLTDKAATKVYTKREDAVVSSFVDELPEQEMQLAAMSIIKAVTDAVIEGAGTNPDLQYFWFMCCMDMMHDDVKWYSVVPQIDAVIAALNKNSGRSKLPKMPPDLAETELLIPIFIKDSVKARLVEIAYAGGGNEQTYEMQAAYGRWSQPSTLSQPMPAAPMVFLPPMPKPPAPKLPAPNPQMLKPPTQVPQMFPPPMFSLPPVSSPPAHSVQPEIFPNYPPLPPPEQTEYSLKVIELEYVIAKKTTVAKERMFLQEFARENLTVEKYESAVINKLERLTADIKGEMSPYLPVILNVLFMPLSDNSSRVYKAIVKGAV